VRVARKRRGSNGGSPELVGVAPVIPRCGEMGGISCWGFIAERRVRSASIEVGHPASEHGAGVVETEEQGLVQEFVRSRPWKLSQIPFCIGLPGAMKCQATWCSLVQASIAFEVNSVP
jgi:hypothetical protein